MQFFKEVIVVEKMYDEFFGTGYWEKQYKQQIVIFAKKCIAEAQKTAHNSDYTKCQDYIIRKGIKQCRECGKPL